ncbi:MAG: cytochrome c553 [Granulosicoccus sp.]
MKKYYRSTALLVCLALSGTAMAADSDKVSMGRDKARQCSVCHGKLGIANDPEVPNLAGQSAFYIEKSLHDYQKGIREDRRMTLMVKNLSKEDIKQLAAWYASIVILVKEPE